MPPPRRGKGLRPRCPKTAWAVVPGEASARRRTAVSGGEPEPLNGHSERSAEGAQPKDLLQGRAAERERLLVADLCTGSGCIACSIAYEHPLAHVVATDLAPEAVALASENVAALGLEGRVDVVACDLGEGVDPVLLGAFDLVVSNPPYVPTAVMAEVPREVADFEPALALDGGPDGLDVFRRLVPWCARALRPGGAFAFELHETCLDAAAALARDAGFSDVCIVNDLAGRPRVLTARR